MRKTKQKNLVLNIVNTSNDHPTAEDIYLQAQKDLPNISLGTIYRNLNELVEHQQIKRLKTDTNDHYDKILCPHDHFFCIYCHKIIDIPRQIKKKVKWIDKNLVIDCDIILKGICEKCQER